MAIRLRKDGRLLCAALTEAEEGDLYIDDGLHHYLYSVKGYIRTYPEPLHSELGGPWFWASEAPEGMEPLV